MADMSGPASLTACQEETSARHDPTRPSGFAGLLARLHESRLLRPRIISLGHLLSGSMGGAILMLVTLGIAARALGPRDFGTFAIVLTVARTCERLLRFESWQPLIRFVTAEEGTASPERLASLYAYGAMLDFVSALGAALLSIAAALVLGPLIGLAAEHRYLVAIYAPAIAGNLRGMSSAALRLAGHFRTLAYVQMAAFLLRFALAGLLYLLGRGLPEFVLAWTVSQLFDAALFNALGLRTLRQGGIPAPWQADLGNLRNRFPGFLRFAVSTNLSSGLRTLTHEMDTLLVSAFVGPSAVGVYYLSRRVAKVVQTAGDLLQTVIYPDLARLWSQASRKAVRRLVIVLQLTLGAIGLLALALCWLLGKPALDLLFGQDFAGSFPMLLAQLLAIMLLIHSSPARSALLAMNHPTFVLSCSVFATIGFFASAAILLPLYGAIGANFAHVVFGLIMALLLDMALHIRLHRSRTATLPTAPIEDSAQ